MCTALSPPEFRSVLGVLCGLIVTGGIDASAQAPPASPTPNPEIPERRPGLVQDEAGVLPPKYQDHASQGLFAYGPPEVKVLIVPSAAAPRQYARRVYDEWAWTVFSPDQVGRHGNLLVTVVLDAKRVEAVADSAFHAALPRDSLDQILAANMEAPLRAGRPTASVKRGLGVLLDALGATPTEIQGVTGGPGGAPPRPAEGPSGGLVDALVGLLLALALVLGGIGPFVILAVVLVMDKGWLQYLLFTVGWMGAVGCGMAVSGVVVGAAGELLGLSSGTAERLAPAGVVLFTLGYPAAAWWGRQKFRSMPRERYLAWRQSLTGGALLGFGIGSAAQALRTAVSLKGGSGGFGGFGGGSFGGGGASGSWSASGTAGGAASAASGTASSVAGSSVGGAVSAGTAAGTMGTWGRLRRWTHRFRWYHGVVFVLALFFFSLLGLGSAEALQKHTGLLVLVLVLGGLYGSYRLWRWGQTSAASFFSAADFQGGGASGSWS
jgi:uncharacterized membrane protein YgcG